MLSALIENNRCTLSPCSPLAPGPSQSPSDTPISLLGVFGAFLEPHGNCEKGEKTTDWCFTNCFFFFWDIGSRQMMPRPPRATEKEMKVSGGGGWGVRLETWGASHPKFSQTCSAFICWRIFLLKEEKHFKFTVVVQRDQPLKLDNFGFQALL